MKSTFIIFYVISVALLAGAISSVLPSQQTTAQMMSPNMMRNFTMANGSWVNPNMMGPMMMNPGMMGPMMTSGQNITGSIKLTPAIFNSIASQIKVNLSDAVASAQKQLGQKSRVVAAHLDVENGYLTYSICAIDPDMNIQRLIIDAGNGKVLLTQKLPGFHMMSPNMMGPMMMNPSMMGGMMNPSMMGGMMNPSMMGGMMNPGMFGR